MNKVSSSQSEKTLMSERMELQGQNKVNELFIEIDKLKMEQSKDLEKAKNEFESNLKEIRLIHD